MTESTLDLAALAALAIAISLSPLAIVQLILVLFSRRRAVNSISYVVSLAVLIVVGLGIGAITAQLSSSESGGPSLITAIVFIVLASALILFAVVSWLKRADHSAPAILGAIESMGPIAVATLTLGATLLNPKNLPLLLSAGSLLSTVEAPILVGALFVIVATLPYTAAALYLGLGGTTAVNRLDRVRQWLTRNNRIIMAVLCGVIGIVLMLRGVSALVAALA